VEPLVSYADDDRPPRPRSGSNWVWIAIVFGGVTLGVALMACCGGVVYFGLGVTTAEIETDLRDNPILREHIGEVEKFTMNFIRSVAEDDDDIWVYDVVGTKASGQLTVHHTTNDQGNEEIHSAKLRLKDGTTVELLPEP
jgi:hypothetical protein